MNRTMIGAIEAEGRYRIAGFVETIRDRRTMAFLVLRDGTGRMQLTLEKEKHPELAALVARLTVESTVSVTGTVVYNAQVKAGGREMLPEAMEIASIAEAMPLLKDESGIDARLDYRWIDLRSDAGRLLFEVQTQMTAAVRDFLLARDFVELHTPKLIGAASESGAEVFEVDYFGRQAYLSQSPQFYKQMAMAAGMERIFEVGPVFRAEKSHTRRHATEFTGLDVEMSWIESYEDVMRLEEDMLAEMLERVQVRYGDAIARCFGTQVVVPERPFPRIGLDALYEVLAERYGYRVEAELRGDLTTEAEQLGCRYAQEVYGHEFLFVTGFPVESRAFYHMRGDDGIAQGYDLLWRGVEITTGAQREHRHDRLVGQAAERGLGEDIRFYTSFFRYGCPPHGGFGLGLDRLTMLLLGLSIKEAMFLYRGPGRLTP